MFELEKDRRCYQIYYVVREKFFLGFCGSRAQKGRRECYFVILVVNTDRYFTKNNAEREHQL